MRSNRSPRHLVFLVPIVGVALWAAQGADSRSVRAQENGPIVATSVCEAHELEARTREDPDLEIEIPAEFAIPWPTREACLSHAAAQDPETPGPVQPIPFSHKHHAGLYRIDCQYCHSGTDRSPAAGVPSVGLCMGCHAQFPPSYDALEGVRTLKEHWEKKGKSSVILTSSQPGSQSLFFSQDSVALRSRASVTVPGFRTARRVTSRR